MIHRIDLMAKSLQNAQEGFRHVLVEEDFHGVLAAQIGLILLTFREQLHPLGWDIP
jgi:hypothetical protein